MRVILIRHAESHTLSTSSNIESIPARTSQEDENLTEFGQASAAELGLFLKNNNIQINQCNIHILALFYLISFFFSCLTELANHGSNTISF